MRHLIYDWTHSQGPPPEPGDTLVAMSQRTHEPTGTAYLILTARRVNRRERHPGVTRMAYGVERVDLDDALRAPRCESLVWHSRGRRS